MSNLWETLAELEDLVYSNEESFLKRFGKGKDIMTLLKVKWGSENFDLVYVLNSGQHIVDTFPISEFNSWWRQNV